MVESDSTRTVKVDEDSLIYVPDSWTERLNLESMFPMQAPLEVELGSGDGSFMLTHALKTTTSRFIAVERLLGRIRKLDRKGRRAEIGNLRLIRIEASYFIDWLLPDNSVHALHIYFPDPWPKRKHHKKRLVNEAFTEALSRVLLPDGCVYLRTDNVDYFKQMVRVFKGNKKYTAVETPDSLKEIRTDFEKYFNEQGIPTNYAAYQLGG